MIHFLLDHSHFSLTTQTRVGWWDRSARNASPQPYRKTTQSWYDLTSGESFRVSLIHVDRIMEKTIETKKNKKKKKWYRQE